MNFKIRKIAFSALILLFSASLFAGDIANFVSLGFSEDGKFYAFGEYGMTDKTYRSYAEIYIIDAKANEYAKDGVFRTSPSALTAQKESRTVFLGLQNRASSALAKYKINEKQEGRPIYAQSQKTKTDVVFSFRDFETSFEYNVILHKKTRGLNVAFYLNFDVIRPDGSKKSYIVGNKEYFRPGVKDYNIKKILINSKNNTLVFIIEKVFRDKSGDCIRYMAETIKL